MAQLTAGEVRGCVCNRAFGQGVSLNRVVSTLTTQVPVQADVVTQVTQIAGRAGRGSCAPFAPAFLALETKSLSRWAAGAGKAAKIWRDFITTPICIEAFIVLIA